MISVHNLAQIKDAVFIIDKGVDGNTSGSWRMITGEMLLQLAERPSLTEEEFNLVRACLVTLASSQGCHGALSQAASIGESCSTAIGGDPLPSPADASFALPKKPGLVKRLFCRIKNISRGKILIGLGMFGLLYWSLTADFSQSATEAPTQSRGISGAPVLTFGDPLLSPMESGAQLPLTDKPKPSPSSAQQDVLGDEFNIRNYQFKPKIEPPKVAAPQLNCD